jgi:DNA processing protein
MKARSANDRHPQNDAKGKSEGLETLADDEKLAWLRLIRTPHIGGVTFWGLLSHFGSAKSAIDALPEFAKYGSRISPRALPTREAAEAELEKALAAGMTLHALGEPGYPPLLANVEVPPPLLYIIGSGRIWNRPPIAIVGSRNASAAGLKFAAEISAELGRQGFSVISGLARGIDAAAHRAALPEGTCAVLPGGLDTIYPPDHAGLAADIAQNGLLLSECPPGFVARSQDFPRRNRIISGVSLGVVVVEAAARSGSLITARLAAEQNREVFAVPGHPFEPRAAGTNELIKDGAVFTTSAKDVHDALQAILGSWEADSTDNAQYFRRTHETRVPFQRNNSSECFPQATTSSRTSPLVADWDLASGIVEKIQGLLSFSPIDVDDLCRLSGIETRHVHAALLSLDLAGRIERRGLRQVALKP